MEIKINREIRDYTESIFFGLSMRQFLCSLLGVLAAVSVYFLYRDRLGTALTGWLCIFATLPFGLLGFVRYNGMHAEKILIKFFQTMVLIPKFLPFRGENLYIRILSDLFAQHEKELRKNAENPRARKSHRA